MLAPIVASPDRLVKLIFSCCPYVRAQIASMVSVQGQSTPVVRNVLTLNTCASIVGAEVMCFEK
jgi:hypothetical protein